MLKKSTLVVLFMLAALGAGCKSELDNKTAALVEESSAPAEAEQAEELSAHAVDLENSSIGWLGAKVTGDHTGGFSEWSGEVFTEDEQVQKLEFNVVTGSIFSDTERLTGHLKSEDFFHVEKYPEAIFSSTKVVEKPGVVHIQGIPSASTHEITGDFTVRGVTKSVTFPAIITMKEGLIQAQTEFTFKRFDFDIAYKGKADDLIRDEVLLKIALVAPMDAEQS